MSLRYMEVELRREPSDIIHWVRYGRFGLRHLLPTRGTPGRDGKTVLVISHLHPCCRGVRHTLSVPGLAESLDE